MARKVDPNDPQYQGREKHPRTGVGKKLLAALGFERYRASTGSRMLSIRFLALHDYVDGGKDANTEIFENFTIEDSSLWRFMKFVNAIGWGEPFDVDDDGDVEKIITSGYVIAEIEMDSWGDKSQPKIKRFEPVGELSNEDPAWEEWIDAGEERHAEYLQWRASNPRGSNPRGGGRGGRGGGRGGGGGGSSRAADDDIPF